MMAGYNWQAGMSHNAVDAYESGELPASKMAAKIRRDAPRGHILKRCQTDDVRKMGRAAYHHTSKMFNETSFYGPYDAEDIKEVSRIIAERLGIEPPVEAQLPPCKWCGIEHYGDGDLCGQCAAVVYVSCNPAEAWRFTPGGIRP